MSDLQATALEVLVSQVGDMREDIRDMRNELKDIGDNKVSYREWAQRNTEVNGRLSGLGREIGDLRTEIRAKSAPWWSVGAVITSVGALAWTILGPN